MKTEYRVVKFENHMAVHEIEYNQSGHIAWVSPQPVHVYGMERSDLIGEIRLLSEAVRQKSLDARRLPILEAVDEL